jgi:cytochrome c-type biogenesis protein CcmH
MTIFILLTLALSLIAVAFIALPLVRGRSGTPRALRSAGLVLLLLLGAGAALYAWLGNSAWMASGAQSGADQAIPSLARHLEQEPDDLSGWLELGQAYGAIGNYSLALRCYQRANRLAGGESAAALAGMAEAMLMGDDASQGAQAAELIERALQIDPHSPKALFYSAVAAYRDGRLAVARQRFQLMMDMGPPESIRTALQRQIDEIDAQMKEPAAGVSRDAGKGAGKGVGKGASVVASQTPVAPSAVVAAPARSDAAPARGVDAATAIHLHLTLSPTLAGQVPAEGWLFVFVRGPGGGPPLAVKRLSAGLPQDVDLSSADAMVVGHSVEAGQNVSVVARISASGSPLPQSGDLYGEIQTIAGKGGAQALQIDKRSP